MTTKDRNAACIQVGNYPWISLLAFAGNFQVSPAMNRTPLSAVYTYLKCNYRDEKLSLPFIQINYLFLSLSPRL